MSKNTNLSFLTDYITADITNGRIGINNASPTVAFDVTGVAKFSSSVGVGGTATGTYGTLSVFGGISTKNDNNGKLEIGRYSSGVPNSYIKLGANSDSLRITNNTDAADLVTITNSGNVGIGSTTPSNKLEVIGASGVDNFILSGGGPGATLGGFKFGNGTGVYGSLYFSNVTNDVTLFQQYVSGNLILGTNTTERMRITSGGAVCIGTTSPIIGSNTILHVNSSEAGPTFKNSNSAQQGLELWSAVSSGNNLFIEFTTETSITSRGSIDYNRSAGLVRYNVTSDYRLKTDLKEFNGNDILNKIKVYDYKLKETNARVYGVMAHELQEIIPYAVGGVKDGEKMQSVDYSIIVPIMVQAIQELKAEIETLKNK